VHEVKLGILVRANNGGLGWQTAALCRMLEPSKVMIIDSQPFNGAAVRQYPERFAEYESMITNGFPTDAECHRFLDGLTHVLTCETFYNYELLREAQRRGIKTFLQANFEFADHLTNRDLPLPTKFLAPSPWKLDVMNRQFGERVVLLPPPAFSCDFASARLANQGRKGRRRFLHVVGKPAAGDRNGTMLLMYAMQRSRADFELVVKSQKPLQPIIKDKRITWDSSAPDDQWRLYAGFDALIMPRRYGGLCLPRNEALTSGLPVIMSNTSPNDAILPADWLVPGAFNGGFTSRVPIPYFNVNVAALARKLDEWATMPDEALDQHKARALELSRQFDPDVLRPQYEAVFRQ
jgi:glycosyltransferase involved in cell wall biosynthesis